MYDLVKQHAVHIKAVINMGRCQRTSISTSFCESSRLAVSLLQPAQDENILCEVSQRQGAVDQLLGDILVLCQKYEQNDEDCLNTNNDCTRGG